MSKAGLSTARLGDTSVMVTASASLADQCANLGNALYGVTQAINSYWVNFWGNLAGDILHDAYLGVAMGAGAAASGGAVVIPVAVGVGGLIAFDLIAAAVEYQVMLLERNIIAGEMRGYGCV